MPTRGQSHIVIYRAINTLTGALVSGDVGNHTLLWSKDGAAGVAPSNAPSARATAGFYQVVVSATEADCEVGVLTGVSATANVLLERVDVAYDVPVRLAAEQELYAPAKLGDEIALSIDGFTGAALSQLRALPAVTSTPVVEDSLITLVQGDDYYAVDGRAISLVDETGQWPDLSKAEVWLVVSDGASSTEYAGGVEVSEAFTEVRFELSASQTSLSSGFYDYRIYAMLENEHRVTLQLGKVKVVG